MTIATRLKLNALLLTFLVAILGLAITLAMVKLNEAREKGYVANHLMRGAFELNAISDYYLRHPEERPQVQWKLTYDDLVKTLKGITPGKDGERFLVNRMNENLSDMAVLFSELVETYEKKSTAPGQGNEGNGSVADAAKAEQMIDLILLRTRELSMNASRLVAESRAERESFTRKINAFVFTGAITLILIVMIFTIVLARSIAVPLQKLRAGVEIIGSGNLDHRIGISTNDEIGELAAAFDCMTERIRKSQEELSHTAAGLREAQRIAHIGSWELDAKTGNVSWSEELHHIFGHDPKQSAPNYQGLDQVLTPVSLARMNAAMEITLQNGSSYEIELELVRPDRTRRWINAQAEAVYEPAGRIVGARGTAQDITERKRSEEALFRLNRELRAVSRCNQILVRADDEQVLLNDICRIVCDEAGYRMAWVGYVENDDAKTIRPVAWAGFEDGYLEQARLTWSDTERGRSPAGIAVRSGDTVCVQDFTTDPRMAPWREIAMQRGYHSGIALPLKDENANVFGILMIYSPEPNVVNAEETRLMEGLAEDLAFGIMVQRARIESLRVKNALLESEELYRSLVENIDFGVTMIDNDFKIVMTNAMLGKWFKKPVNEFTGKNCFREFEKRQGICKHCPAVEALADGRPHQVDTEGVRDDGSRFSVRVHVFPLYYPDGASKGFIEVIEDITERKLMEEEIRWNLAINQSLSSLYIPLVTAGTDIEQIVITILEKSRLLTSSAYGYVAEIDPSTGDMIAHTFTRMMHECKVAYKELRKTKFPRGVDGLYNGLWGHSLNTRDPFYTNEPVNHHASVGIPEGHIAVERFLSVPVLICGELVGQITLANSDREYTDRDLDAVNRVAEYYALAIQHKRSEEEQARTMEQLRQSQKMEAVGLLAGGIAHDFNNLLMAIVSYGGILQMKMTDDDPLRPNVDKVLTVVDRAAGLTQSLLAFSRKQVIDLQPSNLNDIIRKVEKLLARIIGEDIEIQTTFREEPLAVNIDSGQIEQVLMNLATNARDAMPHGGSLSIVTESTEIDSEYVKAHGYGEPGGYALFSITDTGTGMDAATTKRIFEPFFTTKEMGKGTGLGLAVVYGIVKQHGGYINVYSEPDRGTTFRIYLPLLKGGESTGTEPASLPMLTGGTETILLAEDDAVIRELVKEVLMEFGYTVIVAVNGEDAVRKFTENRERIQLLLLDLIMPKMNGKDACDEIGKMGSDVRAIFISGYPPDVILKKCLLEEGRDLIRKPVSPQNLLRKIREVLDR